MNILKSYFFIVFYLFANTAQCAEYGIGVGLNNNYNYSIYFPININEYRLEPSIVHSSYTTTYDNTSFDYNGVGLGFFKTVSQSANTKLFFGPRVSYLVYSSDAAGYVKTTETTFSPTLGFEYYLAENFTLGGEAFFNFTKSEGTNSTLIRSKATGSMITIKYFFK